MKSLTMPSFTIINRKKQKFTVLYDVEFSELIAKYKWSICRGYVGTNSNISDGVRRVRLMHRLMMNPPVDLFIDHINGNRADNRKENLRICTRAENGRNRKLNKNNSSGYKGVYWEKEKRMFKASIRFNGKTIHIGRFKTALEAAQAYNLEAQKLFGEFARPNKI